MEKDGLALAGSAEKKGGTALGKTGAAGTKGDKHLVKLSRAYKFEDEGEITSIDLSCLEDATAETLMKANRVMVSTGDVMAVPENDIRYALFIAAECTGLPYSFYKKLNLADATKVKREVMVFLNGGE